MRESKRVLEIIVANHIPPEAVAQRTVVVQGFIDDVPPGNLAPVPPDDAVDM